MVTKAFQRFDQLHTSNRGGQTITKHMDETIGKLHVGGEDNPLDELLDLELEQDNYKILMAKMFQEAGMPLYEGCPTSHLTAILLLPNLVTTHEVSNTFVDELFTLS